MKTVRYHQDALKSLKRHGDILADDHPADYALCFASVRLAIIHRAGTNANRQF
jgi:hypothetical protein